MTLASSQSIRKDVRNEELKRRLIGCVNEQTRKFLLVTEQFNALDRREEHDYLKLCNEIIQAIDDVLAAGNWDASLFLRNTIRPLKKIREQALELRQSFDAVEGAQELHTPKAGEDCATLYVSLYQADGHDMKKWADQLSSLGSYMVGRPVYRKEEDAILAVRKKLSQTSEAYVAVAVDKSKIISSESVKPRKDKSGSELVNLVPDAIDRQNILEFVHQNKRYYFCDNRLRLAE